MEKKSDDELRKIVADTSGSEMIWEPEAIEAAKRILSDRGLEPSEAQQYLEQAYAECVKHCETTLKRI